LNDPELVINCPLRIIGDEKDPSHVVIEVSGSIDWNSPSGYIEGITLRRPRISSGGQDVPDVMNILSGAKLTMAQCIIQGNISTKELVVNKLCLNGNGIAIKDHGQLVMIEVST
jgi:hypothetical protein